MYWEMFIAISNFNMHFVCIQNIFTIYYGSYNIKYCQLNFKIFWEDNCLRIKYVFSGDNRRLTTLKLMHIFHLLQILFDYYVISL